MRKGPTLRTAREGFQDQWFVFVRDLGGGEAAIGWGATKKEAMAMARETLKTFTKKLGGARAELAAPVTPVEPRCERCEKPRVCGHYCKEHHDAVCAPQHTKGGADGR